MIPLFFAMSEKCVATKMCRRCLVFSGDFWYICRSMRKIWWTCSWLIVRFHKLLSQCSSWCSHEGLDQSQPWISQWLPWMLFPSCCWAYFMFGKRQVPMTVRCAAGNGVGSAAQHSCLWVMVAIFWFESCCSGTPAEGLLKSSIRDNNQWSFLNTSKFNQKIEMPVDPYFIPLGVGEIKREGTDVTVVTYGKMLRRVMQLAEELAEGISVE